MTFKCMFQGLLLPLGGKGEMDWPNPIRLILYLMGLGWTFLGVAVISDVFMAGIEKITSSKKRVKNKEGRTITVYVWNGTVANLTLMALGSSAPEILLSLIEITSDNFFLGPLGAGTIVGSAAFNLLIISAVCVCAIPDGEVRYIKQVPVYAVTASCSVAAYLWLMFILKFSSKDVCDLWEALLTLMFCPMLVVVAYVADRGYFSKKSADDLDSPDNTCQTLPDDATDDELAQIEQEIRNQHGANLTQDQVVKIMKVQFLNKRSRAYYRHAAMDAQLHGQKVKIKQVESIQEALNCTDDIEAEKARKRVAMTFASEKYAVSEAVGKAQIAVIRVGPANCKVSVHYVTKEGTAKAENDYDHVEGDLTFEKEETEKMIEINIKDDTAFENDEFFTVELSNAKCEEGSDCQACLGDLSTTQVIIIDDDMPGDLRFKTEEMAVVEGATEQTVNVTVERFNGGTGEVTCQYRTENMSAVAGVDYEESKGTVKFGNAQQTATVAVTVNAKGRTAMASFNVVISEASEGSKMDKTTDGGEDECICHVNINAKGGEDQASMFVNMRDRVQSANAIMGQRNWAQQFKDALFQIGDAEDDEDGDGPPPAPGKLDIFVHVVSVPWKLLFAFVPPVDYCGGWACFCGALCMIAVVTAIVGDMANLVGCTLDVLPETAAITFVALGTSLPDTFASKTAALLDPHADASIGNVTGSNAINVFMGIGIAWCLAAIYWEAGDVSDEWKKRARALAPAEQLNVMASCGAELSGLTLGQLPFDNCSRPVFIAPGGTIWFNLMVFCVNAMFALQHLYARRARLGGELGGPKKGFMGQYFTGAFLIGQWFIYVIASIVFARLQDEPISYGKLAE